MAVKNPNFLATTFSVSVSQSRFGCVHRRENFTFARSPSAILQPPVGLLHWGGNYSSPLAVGVDYRPATNEIRYFGQRDYFL